MTGNGSPLMFQFDGELPCGWRWGTLSEVLTQRKMFFTIDDATRYKRVRVQLHGRGIVLRDETTGATIKTKRQQALEADDFLVAEIDAKMGGFGIVPDELVGAIVSSHYFVFEVNSDVLLHSYFEAFIRTGYITGKILEHVRGSLNYAAIRPRHVLDIEFPFAPLDSQAAIADDFSSMDRARAAIQAKMEAIHRLPYALLRARLNGN